MSDIKIETLTPTQEALIPIYQEKWRKIALSTEPIDCQKAANAVKEAYKLIGYQEPEVIFCDSPFAACKIIVSQGSQKYLHLYSSIKIEMIRRSERSKLSLQLNKQLSRQLGKSIPNLWSSTQLVDLLSSQLKIELNSLLPSAIYFPDWAYTGSSFDFFISVLNCTHDPKIWQIFQSLVFNCSWIVSYDDICYICDRPRLFSFDSQQKLHAEGQPAIQFADGWGIYAEHGLWLPEK